MLLEYQKKMIYYQRKEQHVRPQKRTKNEPCKDEKERMRFKEMEPVKVQEEGGKIETETVRVRQGTCKDTKRTMEGTERNQKVEGEKRKMLGGKQ